MAGQAGGRGGQVGWGGWAGEWGTGWGGVAERVGRVTRWGGRASEWGAGCPGRRLSERSGDDSRRESVERSEELTAEKGWASPSDSWWS